MSTLSAPSVVTGWAKRPVSPTKNWSSMVNPPSSEGYS